MDFKENSVHSLFFNNNKINTHIMMFGTTGKGKTFFYPDQYIKEHKMIMDETGNGMLNYLDNKNSEQYEEMRKQQMNIEKIERRKKEAKIKRNHLNLFTSMEEIYDEFHHVFDYSEQFFDKKIETLNDFCILYFNIPQDLFGKGISWGFDDSVVRDDLYELFEDKDYEQLERNYHEILKLI